MESIVLALFYHNQEVPLKADCLKDPRPAVFAIGKWKLEYYRL
jgi:hypothetical protein